MTIHVLKTHPAPFRAVRAGEKTYEIRFNDRRFSEGDQLELREWDPETKEFSRAFVLAEVTYMTRGGEWGLPDDLCVMALRPILSGVLDAGCFL